MADTTPKMLVQIPTTETRTERVVAHQIPKQFTVFIIKIQYGDKEWQFERRFSDFLTLHRTLKLKFPMVVSMFAQTFPKKHILPLKTLDPKTVEERRVFFETYLKALSELSPRPGDVNAFLQFDIPSVHEQESSAAQARVDVTLDDFEVLETLGSGAFGKVLLVRKLGSDDLYAMKVLKKDEVKRRNQVEHTLTERAVMESIQHPFIVPLRFAFQSKSRLFMVSEFCPGGELFYHLREARAFNEEAVKFYVGEILMALEHLHSQGIVYRDLKPENVLLDSDGHVRVTDFGLSKQNVTYDSGAKTYCGTPEYLAPEMILCKREDIDAYGFSVDWWSLGTFSYELFVGYPPFQDRNVRIMTERILTERVRFPANTGPTMMFRDFVMSLLQRDPNNRLGIVKNVRDHLFFEDIVWDDVLAKKYKPPVIPHIDPTFVTVNFDPQEEHIEKLTSTTSAKLSSQAPTSASSSSDLPNHRGMRRQFLRFVPKAVARAVTEMSTTASAGLIQLSSGGGNLATAIVGTSTEVVEEDELTQMFKSFAFEREETVAEQERQIPLMHLSSTQRISLEQDNLGEDLSEATRQTAAQTLQEDFEALWGKEEEEK